MGNVFENMRTWHANENSVLLYGKDSEDFIVVFVDSLKGEVIVKLAL